MYIVLHTCIYRYSLNRANIPTVARARFARPFPSSPFKIIAHAHGKGSGAETRVWSQDKGLGGVRFIGCADSVCQLI